MEFLRSSKCSKTIVELTQKLTTGKTASHSWYFYVVANVGHCYVVIIEGLRCSGTTHLKIDCSNTARFSSLLLIFFIYNYIMNANSVENHCCCVECKITSKSYIQNIALTFRTSKYCFHLERYNQNSLFGNKRVIYEPGNESLKLCTLFSSRSSCLWMVFKIAKMKHFRKFSVTFTVNSFSNKYAENSIKKGLHNGIFQGNFLKHLFSKHLRTVIF